MFRSSQGSGQLIQFRHSDAYRLTVPKGPRTQIMGPEGQNTVILMVFGP